jgi:hypothetical protein
VDRRLALRAFVRVEGQLAPAVALTEVGLTATAGLNPFAATTATVRAVIANTGNARLVPTVFVEVTGPLGWFPAVIPAWEGTEILPGAVIVQEFQLPQVRPLGWLTARVKVMATAVGTGATGLSADASGDTTAWVVPWTALIVVVLTGFAVWWAARRRRPTKGRASPTAPGLPG